MTRLGNSLIVAGLAATSAFGLGYAYSNPESLPSFGGRDAEPPKATATAPIPPTTLLPEVDKNDFVYTELFVGSNGYAWPVGRPHRSLYGAGSPDEVKGSLGLPCEYAACHHDQTPALDFYYEDAGSHNLYNYPNAVGEDDIVGEPVRAIISGEIIYARSYKDIPDCYQIKLQGSDGYNYWYGHTFKPSVEAGQDVATGDLIATVGNLDCVGHIDPSSTFPHVHIDAVLTGQNSGDKANRQPHLIDVLNQLYLEMPD
jgi:Peptidase family M23